MWNLVLVPLGAGKRGEFWGKGIGFGAFISSFLLVMPLFFAALPIGMILANLVAWTIPPARRAFVREAEAVRWIGWSALSHSPTNRWRYSMHRRALITPMMHCARF